VAGKVSGSSAKEKKGKSVKKVKLSKILSIPSMILGLLGVLVSFSELKFYWIMGFSEPFVRELLLFLLISLLLSLMGLLAWISGARQK